ncbi:hypothetical protein VMCG_09036 [Cytospora schulzeri]|uniref:Uncharacterized protein n=1 Tax=Cytospora schulzeri TaxID=448051 RepID=A0A423VP05_9PEZI|nr:hypothetical protein VMCG_09036 [Valsa malicola]
MDFVTIIGLVASIVQLGKSVADLSGKLRQSRHHGEQLTRLRDILQDLSQLRVRIGKDHPDVERIRKLVEKCRTLIEEHDPNLKVSRGVTFTWPASLDNEIRMINEDLVRMYTKLQLYSLDLPPTPGSGGSQQGQAAASSIPPYTLPNPALTPSISRRGSIEFIDLPTALSLGETDPRIALQRVNILERDNWSRILQYESDDRQVIVTHRIPFGTKPTTDDDIRAKTVHFLSQHEITVEDNDGFRIYYLDPTYTFTSSSICKQFISKVRERELIETFLPKEIYRGNERRARLKVLRIWRKYEDTNPSRPLVTISFLDRNEGRQTEWDLRLCSRDAHARGTKVVDVWREDGTTKLSLTFESSREAKKFIDVYEAVHPERPPALPVSPPSLPPLFLD